MFYFAKDKLTNEVSCVVEINSNNEHWFIPLDESNLDYQRYLAWVAEGNEATEYVCPFPEVTPNMEITNED